jgi:hypothetical protein
MSSTRQRGLGGGKDISVISVYSVAESYKKQIWFSIKLEYTTRCNIILLCPMTRTNQLIRILIGEPTVTTFEKALSLYRVAHLFVRY